MTALSAGGAPADRTAHANAAFAGMILISLGVAFSLLVTDLVSERHTVGVVLIALGCAFFADAALRASMGFAAPTPAQRAFVGVVLVGVGLVAYGQREAWPLALVVVGGAIVARSLLQLRSNP